jgi:hypothetical protein
MATKEILVEKKETTQTIMPWKGKYSGGDYIDSQGFGTDHHNEVNDSPSSEINEEVTANDRRNDHSECLLAQAADMNNGMVFHDASRNAVWEEVLINAKTQGDDNYVVPQAADRNNDLAPYKTSRRKDNEEAMTDMMFHNTSRCTVNQEILTNVGRNGDDCVVPQDNDRNMN